MLLLERLMLEQNSILAFSWIMLRRAKETMGSALGVQGQLHVGCAVIVNETKFVSSRIYLNRLNSCESEKEATVAFPER